PADDDNSSNCQPISGATVCGRGGAVSNPPTERGCLTAYDDCAMKSNIDALMRNYTGAVPGAAVLLLHDGQPIVRAGYGLADVETDTPATPETNYRLASVTKQFTAASILLLAEDGRLALDDRVRKWL